MTEEQIEQAVDGIATFFMERQTCSAVVARQMLRTVMPDDDRLIDQLIRERRRETRFDGSVDGSLHATAWSAWELLQLGCTKGHTGLDRMIGYLLAQQDQPGRFAEGCSEQRHEIAHCKHFMSGFFSPASRDEAAAPLALPTQVIIMSEFGARFAASCFALRTVLQAGEERRAAVRNHVDSLLLLADRWQSQNAFPKSLDVVFCAVAALAAAPREHRDQVSRMTAHLCTMQQPDGLWSGTSLFHALDTMLSLHTSDADDAIRRAIPPLLAMQQASGAFETEHLTLMALRTLRTAKDRAPRSRPRPQPHPLRGEGQR